MKVEGSIKSVHFAKNAGCGCKGGVATMWHVDMKYTVR